MKALKTIVAIAGLALLTFPGAAQSMAAPLPMQSAKNEVISHSTSQRITLWSGAQGRKIQQTEGNLRLVLATGDFVDIADNGIHALWKNAEGITLITFDAKQIFSTNMATIGYDETDSILYAQLHDEKKGKSGTKWGCTSKWIAWGWTLAWEGLVCVPAGVATGGVGAFICTAAGGAIGTAVSC